jgi:hypothetical protein
MISQCVAIIATFLLSCVIGFQLLLAAGFPLGRGAWGGQFTVLPRKLRFSSLVAAGILALAAWIVLTRASLVVAEDESMIIRVATWVFVGFFVLNTLGNIVSKSLVERRIMTPVTLLLAACFAIVALS